MYCNMDENKNEKIQKKGLILNREPLNSLLLALTITPLDWS